MNTLFFWISVGVICFFILLFIIGFIFFKENPFPTSSLWKKSSSKLMTGSGKKWSEAIQKLATTFTALAVTAAAVLVAIILYQRLTSAKIRDVNHPGTDILVQRAVRAEQKAERERNSQTKPPKGHNFPLNQTVLFQKGVSYQFTRGINTTLCFDPSDHTVRIRVENGNLGWTLWFDESKNVHFEHFKDNPAVIEGWSFSVDKDVYMRLYWY